MPALHCPDCKKTYQVPDPAPGSAMPAYGCPACKTPLTAPAAVAAEPPDVPTLTAARKHRPRRSVGVDDGEPVQGGGWIVCLILVLILNGAGLLFFFEQKSAPQQAAAASLQTALTLMLFVAAYCIERMGKKD